MSLRARHGPQGLHEDPVSDAAALTARLVVREPEVNAVQDPHLDDVLRSFREAVVLPWVHGQARCRTQDRELEFIGTEVKLEYPGEAAREVGLAGGVVRIRRRPVGIGQPVRIADGAPVEIVVALPDGRFRAPEAEVILRVPTRDQGSAAARPASANSLALSPISGTCASAMDRTVAYHAAPGFVCQKGPGRPAPAFACCLSANRGP